METPPGRIELGERPRDGIARELEEETNLTADPDDLTYATDARVYTPDEFDASDQTPKHTHVDRFGKDSLDWLHTTATTALTHRPPTPPRN